MSFIPQTKTRSSPLTISCGGNHLQVTQLLINNGANINYKDGVCDNCHYCFHTFNECFPAVWQHSSSLGIQGRPPYSSDATGAVSRQHEY